MQGHRPRRRPSALSLLLLILTAASARAQQPRYALDTLQVAVGSRVQPALPLATRAVEVLSAQDLARTPARNVADLLAWALGVDVLSRSPALADVSIRGGSFEQVLVLVDGARMSDPQTGHFDMDLAIPLGEVRRIEILRGPASALYGSDAMGGVINIVTRRGGSGVEGRVGGGSFGTAGLALAGYVGGAALGARVAGRVRRSDGHRSGTDYRSAHARVALGADVAGRELRADLAFAARDFGAADFYAPYPSYEETRVATASLAWPAPADAKFAIEPRINLRRHDDDFILVRDDPSLYRNVHTSWQLGGEVVARYAASPSLGLVVGGEAYRDLLESASLGERGESRAAAFAEVAAGSARGASLSAGLRADWHSAYGAFAAPSLSGALWPTEGLRVRASLGRSFRAPTWTERFYVSPGNVGDPDLDPERAWSVELGADVLPARGVRLGLTAFARNARSIIDWARPLGSPPEAPWHSTNVQRVDFRGVEVDAEASDLLGALWTARITALSVDAEAAAGLESKYALRPLTHTISLAFARPLVAGLSLSARLLHAGRQDEESHLRADLRLTWSGSRAKLYLDVMNAADAHYADVAGAPVAGRAVYVGLIW